MSNTCSKKVISLRTFITIAICLIVTAILLLSSFFYYHRTSLILTDNYEKSFTAQLTQVNQKINDQIEALDSIVPLFLSNTLLLDTLESSSASTISAEQKISIEKQMSSIYYSTSIANHNFTDSIFVVSKNDFVFHTFTSGSFEPIETQSSALMSIIDKSNPRLICCTLPSNRNSLYFIRNLFNSNTGKYMGTFVISINREKWMQYCVDGLDSSWFICLFNENMVLSSSPEMEPQCVKLSSNYLINPFSSFQEVKLCHDTYFLATEKLPHLDIVSAVVAPKNLLTSDLNSILKPYLFVLIITIIIAIFAAIIISQTITRPIERMTYYINQISDGKQSELPDMKMYHEFEVWADSFNQMLKQLDIYYTDNFQKQLLLKNSEIRALQSQINPHFLFNVLNTIAWKAQMTENEEIYQMVISLGELLKANTLSKETDFITLEKEIEYVKFYVYLQQRRFEDKIDCIIQIPDELMNCPVPCFCIQPLVENAIIHGLEPKRGKGKLIIQIIPSDGNTPGSTMMDIAIIDNGVGFDEIPDIHSIPSSSEDTHTHIGLRNLDKRLELLFGSDSRLKIDSIPNLYTSVSFCIPKTTDS